MRAIFYASSFCNSFADTNIYGYKMYLRMDVKQHQFVVSKFREAESDSISEFVAGWTHDAVFKVAGNLISEEATLGSFSSTQF